MWVNEWISTEEREKYKNNIKREITIGSIAQEVFVERYYLIWILV